jgi:hypothetical protein
VTQEKGQYFSFIFKMAIYGRFGDIHLLCDGPDGQMFTSLFDDQFPCGGNDLFLPYDGASAILCHVQKSSREDSESLLMMCVLLISSLPYDADTSIRIPLPDVRES